VLILFYKHIHLGMRFYRLRVNGSVSWIICTVHTTSPADTVKTCFLRIGHERSRVL